MALTLGTNAGFVTEAPTGDPSATVYSNIQGIVYALKHTSPAGENTITEIGWWCDNTSNEANYRIGLYSHDAGNDDPDALLYSDLTNAKGTGAGWKTETVDWSISGNTVYWIAVAVVSGGGAANGNYQDSVAGTATALDNGDTLANPFVTLAALDERCMAFYALVGTATYSELSGTIASESSVSGDMELKEIATLSGTVAASSSLSASLGFTEVQLTLGSTVIKRLVVAGKDRIYFEDI